MIRVALCLLLAAVASAVGDEVYPLAVEQGANLLANGAMENPRDERLPGWNPFEGGYQVEAGAGRDGTAAARCSRAAAGDRAMGIGQTLRLNQKVAAPIVVSGWSRAEGVSGSANGDYAVYCDLALADGNPLWGQVATFAVGSHDWQRARVVISPRAPVTSITVYGLFRGHTGTVWFDDFSLQQMDTPAGLHRLDGQLVRAAGRAGNAKAQRATTAGLALDMAGSEVRGLLLGGKPAGGASVGGFSARDVAKGTGFHRFVDGACPELGLKLDLTVSPKASAIEFAGQVSDTTGAPRAITLLFALPVGDGWQWANLNGVRPSDEAAEFGEMVAIETGARGAMSRWPLASVARGSEGLTLAPHPDAPAQYRLGFTPSAGLFTLAYDFGLTKITESFPSAAPFRFALMPSRGDWALRGGLDAWHRVWPETDQVRIPEQGIWMAFAATSKVQGWEDFGFRFKEGQDETAWDDAHGLLTFRYSEMGTYWMAMPPEMPRTYEAALAELRRLAADPSKPGSYRFANAVLQSGSQTADGRFQLRFENAPWCNGCVWSLNPSPYLSGDMVQAKLSWGPAQQAAYNPDAKPELDGEYLDSFEGYVTAPLNFRPDHLAKARIPLTFIDGQPVLHKAFSIAEFAHQVSGDLHQKGKLLMANGVPYSFGFVMPWFDVTGTETDWGREGRYTPDDDGIMLLRRGLSGRKPYLLLMNTRFASFGPYVERYFQRALAYGMYPSMFSHNAAEDHYFTKPEWYNRDRELFKRYIPLIKKVAEAGWQPITGARARDGKVRVERFGPGKDGRIYVTLHNPSDQPVTDLISFSERDLGLRTKDQQVSLEPYATQVVTLGK